MGLVEAVPVLLGVSVRLAVGLAEGVAVAVGEAVAAGLERGGWGEVERWWKRRGPACVPNCIPPPPPSRGRSHRSCAQPGARISQGFGGKY